MRGMRAIMSAGDEKGWACRTKVNSTAAFAGRMGKAYYRGKRSI